jgi:hypothetical protein
VHVRPGRGVGVFDQGFGGNARAHRKNSGIKKSRKKEFEKSNQVLSVKILMVIGRLKFFGFVIGILFY